MKGEKLSNIADIRFGINARTQAQGEVACLQGKDFDEYGEIDYTGISYVDESQCKDTDFLQLGDVLFAAKGSRNYAVAWGGEIPRTVASSTFFVIRNLQHGIKPEYLVWFLMSARAERFFERNIKQATVRTVSKKVIEQLEIEVVSAEKQQAVIQLAKHFQKSLILNKIINDKYTKLFKHL